MADDYNYKSLHPKTGRHVLPDNSLIDVTEEVWGLPTDAEAVGDGSIIALLKRLRPPRRNQFSLKPKTGLSRIREIVTETGTGASAGEVDGEIRLQSGTDGSGVARVETIIRGQYRAGSLGEAGIGVRIPDPCTGNQESRWGYFDSDNGFGFGQDANGIFIFRRKAGSDDTKVYQENWNVDVLDGSGSEDNPSNLQFDRNQGSIYNIKFEWYGYGEIRWLVGAESANDKRTVEVHREFVDAGVSIEDPDQPITIESTNNGTSSNHNVYFGGRQFTLVGEAQPAQVRTVPVTTTNYSITASEGTWVPILAIRKKPTFGPSGRTNSVRVAFISAEVATSDSIQFRVNIGQTTGGTAPWKDPDGYSSTESSIQFKTISDGTITTSGNPLPQLIQGVSGASQRGRSIEEDTRIPIGNQLQIVLEVRRLKGASTTVESAVVTVEEQW